MSGSEFMNIWEVETHFKCPVVGAVLDVEKHRSILKRCGYNVSEMKPYEYHQKIMALLHEENSVSVKVNNHIQSRARKWMNQVAEMGADEIRRLWQTNMEKGNVGPLMYAIVSYRNTDIDLLHDVFGEVHMKAHANMTEVFDIRQKLAKTREAMDREKNKGKTKAQEIRKLVDLRKADARRIADLEAENAQLKKRSARLEALASPDKSWQTRTRILEKEVLELRQELESRSQIIRILEKDNQTLHTGYSRVLEEKNRIQGELDTFIHGLGEIVAPPCLTPPLCKEESCEKYRLCARRIFMIGGITKLKAHYKNIVEKAGGEFDYHDGYMKSANTDLEAKVKRSDLVLCPVNCNSHTACLTVKKLCHLHNTPLKILSSSSLFAVSQALMS